LKRAPYLFPGLRSAPLGALRQREREFYADAN
jgi:hypothetical protein